MTRSDRESSIELLRILAVCGVMILHYNAGRAFVYCIGGANYVVLCVLESLCICAVDLFILISGYFLATTQKRNLAKILELYIQLVIVRIGFYVVSTISNGEAWSIKSICKELIPDDYFVVLYMVVYMISPYINVVLKTLKEVQRQQFMIILLLLFSVWPTLVDFSAEILGREWFGLSTIGAFGSQSGISVVNFLLLYTVGAYLRIEKVDEKIKKIPLLVIGAIVCVAGICMWAYVNEYFAEFGLRSAWMYHNPLVILEAVVFFLMFKKLKMQSEIINSLAQGAFICYLVHLYLIDGFRIAEAISGSVLQMLLNIGLAVVSIYLFSYVVYWIYSVSIGRVFNRFKILFEVSFEEHKL